MSVPAGKSPEDVLREFVRDVRPGGCHLTSVGDACACPLCQIDTLVSQRDRYREKAQRAKSKADLLLGPLTAKARELGYALLVHGSFERDIDVVAVPWTVNAVSADDLARALIAETKRVNDGYAVVLENVVGVDPYDYTKRCPEPKPHLRTGWSIHLGGGPYVDLSVYPPVANAPEISALQVAADVAEQRAKNAEHRTERILEAIRAMVKENP